MILYSFASSTAELERLNKAVEAAGLHVPIGAEYPLEQAAEAHRRLEAGHVLGKLKAIHDNYSCGDLAQRLVRLAGKRLSSVLIF